MSVHLLNQTKISALYAAVFSRAPDKAGLDFWSTQATANPTTVFNTIAAGFSQHPVFIEVYGNLTGSAYVNALYTNILGGPGDTAGVTFWTNQLTAGRSKSEVLASFVQSSIETDLSKLTLTAAELAAATIRQQTITNKANVGVQFATLLGTASNLASTTNPGTLAGLQSDAAYRASVEAIKNVTHVKATADNAIANLAAAVASGNPIIYLGSGSSTPTVGQIFTLTAGTNTFTGANGGGNGNDTFDAGLSNTGLATLNSGDRLDGGGGTDELFAVVNSSVTPSSITSIENMTFTVVTAASTIDLANSTGVQNVALTGSTFGATVSGIATTVAVTLRDSAQAHTVTYSGVAGSADSATINLSNMSQAAATVTTIAGIETLTLNATLNDSALGTLTAAQTTTLNVTGNRALNIIDNLGATVLRVDASLNTGGVNLDFDGTTMVVTGGSGNDDFSFEAAGNVSVNGGAGNDTFRFDGVGTLTTADTIVGGDGDDTVNATSAALVAFNALPTTFRITDVERITANTAVAADAVISLPFISTTANRLNLTLANAGASTFNFNAGANTLSNLVATLGPITVDAAGTGITDSLTIVHAGASAVNSLNGQALTSTDFETVTINTTGTGAAGAQTVGAVGITASTGGTPTLNITGSNQLTAGVITATSGSINASGMTAATTGLIMVTGQNTASTITGSSVADTLFGAITTAINQTIDGGAGNDAITGGAGNDVIIGGTGNDTIDGGAGNDNINGGDGDDRVIISANANLNTADTIKGGNGIDTLAFTAAITDAAATFQAISEFEVLELNGAAQTIVASNFINNQTFTRIDFGQGAAGTMSVTNVGAAVTDIRLLEGIDGDTVVFDRLIDNSTNAVAISARNTTASTITALTADDEETISYSSNTAAADITITTLNVGDLTNLSISGAGDLIVTNALTSVLVNTVNASAATGAVSISAANAVVAVTMSGGSGANTFTGGVLNDTITGGAGVDVIVGGAGSDTISTFGGNDIVTGGLGADVINVGSGTDRIVFTADAEMAVTTRTEASTLISIDLVGADIITGMGAGDTINVTGLGYSLVGGLAANRLLDQGGNSLANGLVNNTFELVRGSFVAGATIGSGTFIQNANGNDTLFIIDANQAEGGGAVSFEASVLLGTAVTLTGVAAAADGIVTITLA